jgi:beta-galactosidase
VGHHLWTGVDYLGESKKSLGANSGFLDNCLFRKSWFYYQQSQWSDSPMVHITIGNGTGNGRAMPKLAENWNQTTGPVTWSPLPVATALISTSTPQKSGPRNRVILPRPASCNGRMSRGQPGVIKAIGKIGGKVAATDSIKTAGAPAKIMLKPDRTTLYADGNDASCIEVDIEDADGNSIFTATNTVQFAMTGPGRSLGIASGDWKSNEPFKATSRKAYQGKR